MSLFVGRAAIQAALLCLLLPICALAQDATVAPDSTDATEFTFIVVGGDTIRLATPFDVLGSRVPVALPGVVRTMDVVMTDEIERAAARSVGEILQTVPGVIVSQRQQDRKSVV